jgi:hypothetical protein
LDLHHVLGADDGSVIGVAKFTRRLRESPKDRAWNLLGVVYRVRGGMVVFLEGYPDARQALQAVGLDPSLID